MPWRNKGDSGTSGSRFLLDTNAITELLRGNAELSSLLNDAGFVAASVISELEFLSFSGLSEHDAALFRDFRSVVEMFPVPAGDPSFTQLVVEARREYTMKLPDAIIAATARANELSVVTADEHFRSLNAPWNVRFFTPV